MGDIPLMTPSGTFVVNGVERVVVNQMHRSPGVFFDHDKGKTHASGKLLFNCRIIPNRGSWLDFEYDPKDILFFRIDRKKKLPATTLLYALGYDKSQIVDLFFNCINFEYQKNSGKWITKFNPDLLKSSKIMEDLVDAKNGKVVLKSGSKLTLPLAKKFENDGLKNILISKNFFFGKFSHKDIKDNSGNLLYKIGTEITEEVIDKVLDLKTSRTFTVPVHTVKQMT